MAAVPASNSMNDSNSTRGNGSRQDATMIDLFHVNGVGYDVTLKSSHICWQPLGDANRSTSNKKKTDRRPFSGGRSGNLPLEAVLGARVMYNSTGSADDPSTSKGPCIGIAINFYARKGDLRFVISTTEFENPSAKVCSKWITGIQRQLHTLFPSRPSYVKVFVESRQTSLTTYRSTIEPLFTAAGISQDATEIYDLSFGVDAIMANIDLSLYDSIICVGGDSAVSRVASGLLKRSQTELSDVSPSNFRPRASPLPLGIIPTGCLNTLACSVMGTDDIDTSAVNIILGEKVCVDACSVWQHDRLLRWSFMANFGFFQSVLSGYDQSSSVVGDRQRIEANVVWNLKSKKCKVYDCEIQYVLCGETANIRSQCRTGCVVCRSSSSDIDNSRATSRHRSDDENNTGDSEMDSQSVVERLDGQFASVSVTALPGMCCLAPLGLSKHAHLADGCIDLIVVDGQNRRDFARFLKRLGNRKDQMDLPNVRWLRCKEVQFRLRSLPKHRSSTMTSPSSQSSSTDDVEDLADDGSSSVYSRAENSGIHFYSDVNDSGYCKRQDTAAPNGDDQHSSSTSRGHRRLSGTSDDGGRTTPSGLWSQLKRTSSTAVRSIFSTLRAPVASPIDVGWNVDGEQVQLVDLQFRAHGRLLTVHGTGVPVNYRPDDVRMPCLAVFR